jgi:MinD-like ATPase involved in chromosome partitioning or flagellar assembly
VVVYNQRLSMLAGSASGQVDGLSTVPQIAQFAAKLRREAEGFDLIVIDHSSGISSTAAVLASASDLNLLVLVPELTSISDCYGLYKYLHQADGSTHCRFLFNRVESDNEAQYLWSRLAAMVDQYLGDMPQLAGVLFEDSIIRQAVAGQKPVSALTSDSPVLHSLENMIRGLLPAALATAADHHSGEINILTASADIRE